MSQKKEHVANDEGSIMTLEQSTMLLDSADASTEERIVNMKELKEAGVFSFTFCVICQCIATPSR